MPEFSRTAKRRHTFAFASTRLPLFLHSLPIQQRRRTGPTLFFSLFFFSLFFSFPFSSMPTRVERGKDTVHGSPSIRWKRVFPPDIGSVVEICRPTGVHAGPRSITTPALSSLFSRPWVLTRRVRMLENVG